MAEVETKQSELPWETYYGGCPEKTNVHCPNGHVASFETPEDAAFATLAANCFAEMLAALRAQEELASLRMEGDPTENIRKVRDQRRAAIARAEGTR